MQMQWETGVVVGVVGVVAGVVGVVVGVVVGCCCRRRRAAAEPNQARRFFSDDSDGSFFSFLSTGTRGTARDRHSWASAESDGISMTSLRTNGNRPSLTFREFVDRPGKHSTPIATHEFGYIYALRDEPDSMWSVCAQKPWITVQKRFDESSPSVLVRCFVELDGVEPDVVLYNLVDIDARTSWDKLMTGVEILEKAACDVMYLVLQIPVVSNRDFVIYRRVEVSEKPGEGQSYRILQRSATHPRKPEQAGCVRGEAHIGGYLIKKSPGSRTTRLFVTVMSDPRGSVPKWIINAITSKKVFEWCSGLRQACCQIQKSEDPAIRRRVRSCAERFVDNSQSEGQVAS